MLSDLQDNFDDVIQDVIDSLSENFKELLDGISKTSNSAVATIKGEMNGIGYTPTDEFKEILNGTNVVTTTQNLIDTIKDFQTKMTEYANLLANSTSTIVIQHAKNTSISTSDRNLKHDIHDIDDNLIKLFFKIKPKTYYFNDGDRIHIGLIAQDFENSMHELGLSENDYGMICKDILYDYTKFDEDGVPIEDSKVTKKDEDGNIIYRYSFRYEELITLIVQVVHNQQKELDDIKNDIANIKQNLGI